MVYSYERLESQQRFIPEMIRFICKFFLKIIQYSKLQKTRSQKSEVSEKSLPPIFYSPQLHSGL